MTVSKIWVFAEAADGAVSNTTLEMLAKARELADTVEVVTVSGNDVAAAVGANGATRALNVPGTEGTLLGAPVAAAARAAWAAEKVNTALVWVPTGNSGSPVTPLGSSPTCGTVRPVAASAAVFALLPVAPYRIHVLGGPTEAAGLFLGSLTFASALSAPAPAPAVVR